jgi:hypothetical protein
MNQMATGILCASAVQRVDSLQVAPSSLNSFDVQVCKSIDAVTPAATSAPQPLSPSPPLSPPPPPPPQSPLPLPLDTSCSSELQHFTLANGAVVTLVVNHARTPLPDHP